MKRSTDFEIGVSIRIFRLRRRRFGLAKRHASFEGVWQQQQQHWLRGTRLLQVGIFSSSKNFGVDLERDHCTLNISTLNVSRAGQAKTAAAAAAVTLDWDDEKKSGILFDFKTFSIYHTFLAISMESSKCWLTASAVCCFW